MAKGIVSQGVCLLTDGRSTIEAVRAVLLEHEFEIVDRREAQRDWRFGGPEITIAYRPEVNGYAVVDVVDHTWPDAMGDPKSDFKTFGSWSLGNFGPFAYPGGLARASQHAWAWEPGRAVVGKHRGFIRLRLSYCFGAQDPDPVRPEDYDPISEMDFLSRAVLALFGVPGVICYFNPNGEVLRDAASFREVLGPCKKQGKLPLALWTNVRFFNLSQQFSLMDTIGNGQLDVQDVEVVFPKAEYDLGIVDYYLRNVTHYLLDLDRELRTGEDIDGPGETNLSWTVEMVKDGTVQPPRGTCRLYPKAHRKAIRRALAGLEKDRGQSS